MNFCGNLQKTNWKFLHLVASLLDASIFAKENGWKGYHSSPTRIHFSDRVNKKTMLRRLVYKCSIFYEESRYHCNYYILNHATHAKWGPHNYNLDHLRWTSSLRGYILKYQLNTSGFHFLIVQMWLIPCQQWCGIGFQVPTIFSIMCWNLRGGLILGTSYWKGCDSSLNGLDYLYMSPMIRVSNIYVTCSL